VCEVLGEHELHEARNYLLRRNVGLRLLLADCDELLVGDGRLISNRVEIPAQRMEVLESLV
jgi:hypothetical protein